MTILILGASGETGRLVVGQLLAQKISVHVVVRSTDDFHALLPEHMPHINQLVITEASISNLSEQVLNELVSGCSTVISCLGHNMSFKGIYGQPRRLVTDSVKRICQSIKHTADNKVPVKFILMNTTGNQNIKAGEEISLAQKITIWLIRQLIPPHADNEAAAEYLQAHISESNEKDCSEYDIYPSPIRSAIFDAGITSRINVAHFMTALVTDSALWAQWKTKMPVIYNRVN
jgi:NAD(P)-dependent dehydrogenase (short-subunit alcohol dehydrogenase family)